MSKLEIPIPEGHYAVIKNNIVEFIKSDSVEEVNEQGFILNQIPEFGNTYEVWENGSLGMIFQPSSDGAMRTHEKVTIVTGISSWGEVLFPNGDWVCYRDSTFKENSDGTTNRQVKLASEESIKWLNICIQWNKYIPMNIAFELHNQMEFPMTWDIYTRYCNRKQNLLQASNYDAAFEALAKLVELRDHYNKTWKPDWTSNSRDDEKHVIKISENRTSCQISYITSYILSFERSSVRDLFLNNFRELIETAKPLL